MSREPRLLVVDDEPGMCDFIRRVANTAGYEARGATEAPAFQKMYREWRPDTVVLDVHIPNMDGVELLRFLAGEESRARILLVSGMEASMLDIVKRLGDVYRLDIVAAMQKPLRAAGLRSALEAALPDPDVLSGV